MDRARLVAADGEPAIIVDPIDGTRWSFDVEFLASNYTCIWGRGCQGIRDEPTEEMQQGCCSLGAGMLDSDEAMNVAALALTIDPSRFQFADAAAADGIFRDAERMITRLVDDACIFLNRPGFEGGVGCALHLEAEAQGERPDEWKPSVCWQLPLKVERPGRGDAEGDIDAHLTRWHRHHWGPGGETMAWNCTDEPECYVGDRPVIDSLGHEIEQLVGTEVYVELRSRIHDR